MIHQLQQIFRSITKSLEVIYVIEGIKPCARILAYEDDLNKIVSFLNEKGIPTAISGFKVVKQNLQSGLYSDISVALPKDSAKKGHFFVYLSKDKNTADKAKLMEESNSHEELGLLLGYPKCCCDFFAENFSGDNADLTLKTLENSDGYEFEFYNNIAARHFDVALLSHFPHSFGCEPSIEIAKSSLKAIQKHSKEAAAVFSDMLKRVAVYTMEEGIFLLKMRGKANGEIAYGDVLATSKSKLSYLLSSNKKLRIAGKNSFFVSGIKIEGSQYGIMVFK